MTPKEAADILHVSTQRVYKLLGQWRLTGTRKEGVRGWASVDGDSVAAYAPRKGGRPARTATASSRGVPR